jgi:hypothetical protein
MRFIDGEAIDKYYEGMSSSIFANALALVRSVQPISKRISAFIGSSTSSTPVF